MVVGHSNILDMVNSIPWGLTYTKIPFPSKVQLGGLGKRTIGDNRGLLNLLWHVYFLGLTLLSSKHGDQSFVIFTSFHAHSDIQMRRICWHSKIVKGGKVQKFCHPFSRVIWILRWIHLSFARANWWKDRIKLCPVSISGLEGKKHRRLFCQKLLFHHIYRPLPRVNLLLNQISFSSSFDAFMNCIRNS